MYLNRLYVNLSIVTVWPKKSRAEKIQPKWFRLNVCIYVSVVFLFFLFDGFCWGFDGFYVRWLGLGRSKNCNTKFQELDISWHCYAVNVHVSHAAMRYIIYVYIIRCQINMEYGLMGCTNQHNFRTWLLEIFVSSQYTEHSIKQLLNYDRTWTYNWKTTVGTNNIQQKLDKYIWRRSYLYSIGFFHN